MDERNQVDEYRTRNDSDRVQLPQVAGIDSSMPKSPQVREAFLMKTMTPAAPAARRRTSRSGSALPAPPPTLS